MGHALYSGMMNLKLSLEQLDLIRDALRQHYIAEKELQKKYTLITQENPAQLASDFKEYHDMIHSTINLIDKAESKYNERNWSTNAVYSKG